MNAINQHELKTNKPFRMGFCSCFCQIKVCAKLWHQSVKLLNSPW